jgi:uncharacterized protein (DUF885 family)
MPGGPAERMRALIVADEESAKLSPDRWPDLSPEALRERAALDHTTLDKLHAVARKDLAAGDRTAYDLFEWSLNRRLEQFRLRLYLTPFWSDDRYVRFAGVLGTAAALSSESRGKVESFPAYARQAVALLREGIREQMLPAADLVRPLSAGCSASSSRANPEDQRWNEARKAAKEFCAFLANEYLPACPMSRSLSRWPNGSEVYQELVRRYTTTDLDPKRIHEFGVSEVARIRAAMLPVIARTGFKGSLDEFLKYARTEPRFYFSNGEDLLTAYRAALAQIQPLVPSVIGHIPQRPLKVEPYEGDVAAMWHAPRSGRPEAVVYVAVNEPEIHPKFEIIPLMLHEGTPGHELQHAVADEVRAGNNDAISAFEFNAGQNLAFAEGWALYAEGLGREMGLYGDPYDEFGELRMDLTRAVRVVIDTGIHADGWSEIRAQEYFLTETGKPQGEVDSEVSRTLWPGGQLAYKVGQFRIQRLREEAAHALGPQFKVRAFHDAILRWGPLPLDILERKLDECLHAPSCAAEMTQH